MEKNTQALSPAEQALREAALEYHRTPSRGKIAVVPTKPLSNQRDLSLAYSPGVAYACLAIEEDPTLASEYTSRGNLVGVVTNGTAVLGLGDIGPLASKPVMEGKGCLFQKFAGIDVFDIELAERDPDKLVDIIAALEYHEFPTPGKIAIAATKQMVNQRDLALAYSPGVAAACEEIVEDPANAFRYTSRGNLVAVITNGTAVLGLGNIGPLAAKPVMEGKAVLFKKFAGIDVFDLELAENDLDKLCDIIAALEPTFGGINLEDIKAPDCFYVERKLRDRMKIPVFHDDQHGTAIIVAAAILNGLKLVGKDIGKVKLAGSGAGAAAIACLDVLVSLGMK
ncbi:MAG: hypothetical protein RJA98_1586, partial [Pseudomonadota bacterium]